jgi:UDP-N-acetylmuramyl pentapeptide synthase
MRFIIEPFLAFYSRRILAKYKPIVIGITGSVGKTSTRAAVFSVVGQKYRAYTPPKNLNDKIGLPMGIIGMDSPGRSFWGWMKVFWRAKTLWILPRKYPEVLVLEYGIDRVGEMDQLLKIAKPNIGVITSIGISHYEFFKSAEVIEQEKGKLVEVLSVDATAVINADNEIALRQREKTEAAVISYGHAGGVRLTNTEETLTDAPATVLHITTPTREFSARIAAVGETHRSSCMAAVAVAEALQIETDLIQKGLAAYRPVPGRLNVFGGLKRSVVIDDTYNAAPDSMHEALELLARFPGGHKIAVLGDMRELGALSDDAHKAVGTQVAGISPSHLVTVGAGGKIIAEAAVAAGYSDEQVESFDTSDEARLTVQALMREGSVVLVKGSQFVRMEKISKEIMAEPMRAEELLCRQYGKWLNPIRSNE